MIINLKFPRLENIIDTYKRLMDIIADIRTVKQAKAVEYLFTEIEINGVNINEFIRNGGTDTEIEWIRYDNFGCLQYIYDRFDGKPMFDVYCEYLEEEFIRDITVDNLTAELYNKAKAEALRY